MSSAIPASVLRRSQRRGDQKKVVRAITKEWRGEGHTESMERRATSNRAGETSHFVNRSCIHTKDGPCRSRLSHSSGQKQRKSVSAGRRGVGGERLSSVASSNRDEKQRSRSRTRRRRRPYRWETSGGGRRRLEMVSASSDCVMGPPAFPHRRFKVGMSFDVDGRIASYNTANPDFEGITAFKLKPLTDEQLRQAESAVPAAVRRTRDEHKPHRAFVSQLPSDEGEWFDGVTLTELLECVRGVAVKFHPVQSA